MAQTYEAWWPLPEAVEERFLDAELTVSFPEARVRLDRGYRDGAAIGPSVVIEFQNVAAATVHEEYVHPWNAGNGEPQWPTGVHVAIVRNSEWVQSFSASQLLMYPDPVHYRVVTEVPIIDVLCTGTPSARIEPAPPFSESAV